MELLDKHYRNNPIPTNLHFATFARHHRRYFAQNTYEYRNPYLSPTLRFLKYRQHHREKPDARDRSALPQDAAP